MSAQNHRICAVVLCFAVVFTVNAIQLGRAAMKKKVTLITTKTKTGCVCDSLNKLILVWDNAEDNRSDGINNWDRLDILDSSSSTSSSGLQSVFGPTPTKSDCRQFAQQTLNVLGNFCYVGVDFSQHCLLHKSLRLGEMLPQLVGCIRLVCSNSET